MRCDRIYRYLGISRLTVQLMERAEVRDRGTYNVLVQGKKFGRLSKITNIKDSRAYSWTNS